MAESESNEVDRGVDESMRMFEKSRVGDAAPLTPIQPSRLLLVLDGSQQDETSVSAASFLQQRFGAETLVLDARESAEDDLAPSIANSIEGAQSVARREGDAFQSILECIDEFPVDLVILPCPFGRDFDKIGTDSAGTVIDVMLSRCPIPMLVIRRDDQLLESCLKQLSVISGAECDAEGKAAAWAFGLAGEQATVTLNLVVEKEQFENTRSIVEALSEGATLDPEAFTEALTKTHHSLHASMAKTASDLGLSYHLHAQAGEVAPPNPLQSDHKLVVVIPLEVDDRFGQGMVQDRIRRSPHPVLVVPSHVR